MLEQLYNKAIKEREEAAKLLDKADGDISMYSWKLLTHSCSCDICDTIKKQYDNIKTRRTKDRS